MKKNAQSSMEVSAALIAVFILVIGSARIFSWVNKRMVMRQQKYESTRVAAGSTQDSINPETGKAAETATEAIGKYTVEVDEEGLPQLKIF